MGMKRKVRRIRRGSERANERKRASKRSISVRVLVRERNE